MTNLSNSLNKLRIIIFWQILKDNNPFLLDADFTTEKVYSNEEKDAVENTWKALYDEFFILKNDTKSRAFLRETETEKLLIQKIKLLVDSRNHLFDLLGVIDILPIDDYERLKCSAYKIVTVTENKLKFNAFVPGQDAIEKIDKVTASLTNAYNIKHKRIKQEVDKKVQNIYKTVAVVEQILERSLANIDEMNVIQWLAYEEIAAEKIKQSKDKKNGAR